MVEKTWRTQPILLTLCCALLAGCSSSPWGAGGESQRLTGLENPPRQRHSQSSDPASQQAPGLAAAERLPQANRNEASDNAFLASLQNAADVLTKPLQIEPTDIQPDDPTSLSGGPKDVGADLHYHAARVCESQQNTQAAVAHYEKALQMDRNHVRTLIAYARLLDRERNFREAERLYLQATRLQPRNAVVLNDLGMLYARQGMLDAALQSLDRAVQLQPSNQRYRNNIAIVLIDLDRPTDAFGHLASVHGEAVAHYNLGFLLSRRGRQEQAAGHLQQSLDLNPYLAPARQMLTKLNMATNQQPRAAEAEPSFRPAGMTMHPLPATGQSVSPGPPVDPLPRP